jgi:hypothetical protein
MKQKTKTLMAVTVVIILIGFIGYLLSSPPIEKTVEVSKEVPTPYPVEVFVQREPEFRKPPIKQYKPGLVQQMGLLLGDDDGDTLPLYGKEVHGRRDRYHYYTSTSGDQVYSLPVTHDNRDCMEDLGCQELYGQESVNVLGKSQSYQATLYRTTNYL